MIYVCELDENTWSDGVQKQTDLRTQKRNRERNTAWKLLEYALNREYGLTVKDLEISRTEHGKPYSTAYPDLYFNLSHCETACACVLSDATVGVDVERLFPYREALAERITSKQEKIWMSRMKTEADRMDAIHLLWSMKESFVKRNGRGLGCGMNQADLSAWLTAQEVSASFLRTEKRSSSILLHHTYTVLGKEPDFLVSLQSGYTLAVCGNHLPDSYATVPESDLNGRYSDSHVRHGMSPVNHAPGAADSI